MHMHRCNLSVCFVNINLNLSYIILHLCHASTITSFDVGVSNLKGTRACTCSHVKQMSINSTALGVQRSKRTRSEQKLNEEISGSKTTMFRYIFVFILFVSMTSVCKYFTYYPNLYLFRSMLHGHKLKICFVKKNRYAASDTDLRGK